MFWNKKKKNAETEEGIEEETVPREATAEADARSEQAEEAPKVVKLLKLEKAYSAFFDIYTSWLKPIKDNWEPMKRRLNGVFTVLSFIFFVAYIPILLFGKIAKGLGYGWEAALYVCLGVYAATFIAFLVVTVLVDKSNSTKSSASRKKLKQIVMILVRLASLAIGITALIISGQGDSSPWNTLAMVMAIVSVIFSAIPILFGSLAGFLKWLISPEKKKFTFQFVALEWTELLTSEKQTDKTLKKASKKCGARIKSIVDETLIPALGQKKIKAVEAEDISVALGCIPPQDINLAEWVVKSIFEYADGVYIESNPCSELALEGDIEKEFKGKNKQPDGERTGLMKRFSSLFKR